MKILITGHKGFVGKHFWTKLDNGHNTLTGIDIKDNIDCRDFFRKSDEQFDLVIHLAAMVGGRETIESRPLLVADNFSIDSEFFQWCLKTKPKKVVYFSSSAAYPVPHRPTAALLRPRQNSPAAATTGRQCRRHSRAS